MEALRRVGRRTGRGVGAEVSVCVTERKRYIRCDMCGRAYDWGPSFRPSATRLRETMQWEGWQRRWGLDICPGCWERIEAEAKEKP